MVVGVKEVHKFHHILGEGPTNKYPIAVTTCIS